MEHMIQLHIEKLPEGVYLATSDDVQGLIAQYAPDEGALKPATLGQIRKRVRQGRMNVRKKLF